MHLARPKIASGEAKAYKKVKPLMGRGLY